MAAPQSTTDKGQTLNCPPRARAFSVLPLCVPQNRQGRAVTTMAACFGKSVLAHAQRSTKERLRRRYSHDVVVFVIFCLLVLIPASLAFGGMSQLLQRPSFVALHSSAFSFQNKQSDINVHDFMDVAAASTQQSCELLGIKSIGVDYGLARTGLALTIGYEPRPITILSESNATRVAQQIVRYCVSEQAQQVIVGLPLYKNGTEAPQSSITRDFASRLACLVLARLGSGVPVYLWDERYTSKEAAARLLNQNPNQNLRKTLDADAACIILENFYLENGKGAERVHVPEDMREVCLQAWNVQQQEEKKRKREESQQRSVSRTERRQGAMERARRMEEAMARDGTLGSSRKKKKKKKRK